MTREWMRCPKPRPREGGPTMATPIATKTGAQRGARRGPQEAPRVTFRK